MCGNAHDLIFMRLQAQRRFLNGFCQRVILLFGAADVSIHRV